MRKTVLLAGLLLALPVHADMYQDGSNAKQPEAFDNLATGVLKKTTNWHGTGLRGLYVTPNNNNWALQIARETVGPGDENDVRCWRNAQYAAGLYYNTCLTVDNNVGAGVSNPNEWNALFRVDSAAAGNTGTILALYAQAWRRAPSQQPTWASVHELRDFTPDPIRGATTQEIDLWAKGTDANGLRHIINLVGGTMPETPADPTPTITSGIMINGRYPVTNVRFEKGVNFGSAIWGTLVGLTATEGAWPSFQHGVDFSSGSCTVDCFASPGFKVTGAGGIVATLPANCTGAVTGTLWNDAGTVKVCP